MIGDNVFNNEVDHEVVFLFFVLVVPVLFNNSPVINDNLKVEVLYDIIKVFVIIEVNILFDYYPGENIEKTNFIQKNVFQKREEKNIGMDKGKSNINVFIFFSDVFNINIFVLKKVFVLFNNYVNINFNLIGKNKVQNQVVIVKNVLNLVEDGSKVNYVFEDGLVVILILKVILVLTCIIKDGFYDDY